MCDYYLPRVLLNVKTLKMLVSKTMAPEASKQFAIQVSMQ